jgi:hypothetical protein
VKKS